MSAYRSSLRPNRFPWIPLLTVLVILGLAAGWISAEWRARRSRVWASGTLDSLGAVVQLPEPPVGLTKSDTLYWAWTAINAKVQIKRLEAELIQQRQIGRTLIEDVELVELRNNGLADPARQLRDSLLAHPELVPYPGYAINDRASIVLLPPPLVYATIDNGNHTGQCLLRYHVEPDGRVTWERLWSGLDETSEREPAAP